MTGSLSLACLLHNEGASDFWSLLEGERLGAALQVCRAEFEGGIRYGVTVGIDHRIQFLIADRQVLPNPDR